MSTMPTTSEASISKGCWFVFPYGSQTIRAWGGSTGIERIYVDEELVSERRSLNRVGIHQFDFQGEPHTITFTAKGALMTQLECTLAKGGVPLKAFLLKYNRGNSFTPMRILVVVILGASGGAAIGLFHLPRWVLFPIVAMIVFVMMTTREGSGLIMEELAVGPFPQAHGTPSSGATE